ncbi:hypothetical protein AB0D08_36810 [Kitasatospora sp. NPDC048540]|uniref:hypothetical protein n=1 Tax=unclassified Kitasatospora TaxID=2633591 RepID=UPI000690DD5B|nr:hypothetical protein [Kitasatospora sp. MBT63]
MDRPAAALGRPDLRALAQRVHWPTAVAAALVIGYVTLFVVAMVHTSYDTWGALLVAPALMAIGTPILARVAAANPEPAVFKLLMLAMGLKLFCAFPRYLMAFVLYGGAADSKMYHQKGSALAEYLDSADLLGQGVHYDLGMKVAGTGFIIIVTGVVYAITGPTLIGGFLVFSWMGFWGLLLFWRAVQIAFPEADSRRYAKLVFFLPSLLFWPSSIGKDAWMMLCLGLTTYGVARLLDRRFGAFVCIALGSLGTAMVRPHVTVLAGAGLSVAYVLRKRPQQVSALGPLRTILSVVVMGAGVMLMLQQVSTFFGTEGANGDSLNHVLSETSRRTSQGSSVINAAPADDVAPQFSLNPSGLPVAVISVLFRPFPFEASNIQNLIQSVECFALLIMFIRGWPHLRQLPRLFLQRSYIAYTVVYTLLFCWAFSTINNMGILSRERVQVLPLFLVLLAVPRPESARAAPTKRSRAPVWRVPPGQWGPRPEQSVSHEHPARVGGPDSPPRPRGDRTT